jgi:MFS family permease
MLLALCSSHSDHPVLRYTGNAKIAGTYSQKYASPLHVTDHTSADSGIEKDLGLKGFDFNIALTVFYVFVRANLCSIGSRSNKKQLTFICCLQYIIIEIPSNLALKHFGSVWLAGMVTSFGAVSLGSAFIKSYQGLLVTRVFLGLAEGGTLSGLVYLLSRFYRRHELVLRIGLFFGTGPTLSGAFGGLLASGLLRLDDIGPIKSWRKIFFVEGLITTGLGLILFFILPNDPRTTKLFNEEERALAIARMDADQADMSNEGAKKEKTTFKLIGRAFNFHTVIYAMGYLLTNISFQGLSLFLPTVVNSLGHYTVIQSQLRTAPPFVVGLAWVIPVIIISHKTKQRAIYIIICMFLGIAGYGIAIGTREPHARYAACFLSVAAGTPSGPMLLAWGAENAAPDTVRAVATAIIPSIGALGSIIAVWTYLPTDAPNFHKGNSLNLAASILVLVLMIVVWVYSRWENAKRERGERDYRLVGKTQEEIEELGSRHPRFRYSL